jgi:hypothetical protein
MKIAGTLLALVVCGMVALSLGASAKVPDKVIMPFEEIGLFDPIPKWVLDMGPEFRIKWAKAHNETAVLKAQQRADAYRARNPVRETYVQNQEYNSSSSLDQNANNGYYNSQINAETQTTYRGRSSQTTYREDQWGGGVVVILNPYTTTEVPNEMRQGP